MHENQLTEPGDECALLSCPSIFMSASVPEKPRSARARSEWGDYQKFLKDRRYIDNSKPSDIRRAVTELCRRVFRNNLNLIFGGHPAISPMVLRAAQLFSHGESDHPRVVVFQSEYFMSVMPEETKELAIWEHGKLLTTADKDGKEESLDWMRRIMIESPGIVACVFIGGMYGVVEEYELVKELRPDLPTIPIASTGGAALELSSIEPQALISQKQLGSVSYPAMFSEIFAELRQYGAIPTPHEPD